MKRKPLLKWTLFAVFLIVIAWSLFKISHKFPEGSDFIHTLSAGATGWIIYSLAFFTANFLRSQRWKYMLKGHIELSTFQAWANFQWLFMVKSLSPFHAGEVVRALWLKKCGGSGSYGVGIFLIERLTDLVVLFFGALLVLYSFFNKEWNIGYTLLFFGLLLLIFVMTFHAEKFNFLFRVIIDISKIHPLTEKLFSKRVQTLHKSFITELSPTNRICILSMTVAIWASIAIGMAGVLYSLDLFFHWSESIGLLVATNFVGFISPLPANIGTYQFAGSGVLTQYGVDLTQAIALTIVMQLVMLFQVSIVGLSCFAYTNILKNGDERR